jgi:hypothetical protein
MAVGVPIFYNPWPNLGKKFHQQLGEPRQDTTALAPFAKQSYLDFDTVNLGNHILTGLAFGKFDFARKFRVFYDEVAKQFKIQFNKGTTGTPSWVDCLQINESDCRVIAAGPGGLQSFAGFYPDILEKFYFTVDTTTEPRKHRNQDRIRFFREHFYTYKDSGGNAVIALDNDPGGAAEANTASNVGTGANVFKQKIGVDLEFRSLVGGDGIDVTQSAPEITFAVDSTIAKTNQLSDFYDLLVKFDGGSQFKVDEINFGPDFYPTSTATGKPVVNAKDLPTLVKKAFTSVTEWEMTHNLNTRHITWACFDKSNEGMMPSRVSVKGSNEAFFYWPSARTGEAIVTGVRNF